MVLLDLVQAMVHQLTRMRFAPLARLRRTYGSLLLLRQSCSRSGSRIVHVKTLSQAVDLIVLDVGDPRPINNP